MGKVIQHTSIVFIVTISFDKSFAKIQFAMVFVEFSDCGILNVFSDISVTSQCVGEITFKMRLSKAAPWKKLS